MNHWDAQIHQVGRKCPPICAFVVGGGIGGGADAIFAVARSSNGGGAKGGGWGPLGSCWAEVQKPRWTEGGEVIPQRASPGESCSKPEWV